NLATWLRRRSIVCRLALHDRPLRAALVAHGGKGLVFLDGTDPDDERRYSLAHETAHFLIAAWWPRLRAERKLGPASLEVLDGRRSPTRTERIDAALAGLALGTRVHLMERTPDGHSSDPAIDEAERL